MQLRTSKVALPRETVGNRGGAGRQGKSDQGRQVGWGLMRTLMPFAWSRPVEGDGKATILVEDHNDVLPDQSFRWRHQHLGLSKTRCSAFQQSSRGEHSNV